MYRKVIHVHNLFSDNQLAFKNIFLFLKNENGPFAVWEYTCVCMCLWVGGVLFPFHTVYITNEIKT